MRRIVNLLQPILSRKDYTYARTRTHPSLREDVSTTSADRALAANNHIANRLEAFMQESWSWFNKAETDLKSTYILAILKESDSQLLYPVGAFARNLLNKYSPNDRDDDHQGNDVDSANGMTHGNMSPTYEQSIDGYVPALSYSGSTIYKDPVTSLPVHLSKYILSLLDHRSLSSSLLVNSHWMMLVSQVREEASVHRNLTDQVMLMQGVAGQCSNALYARDTDVPVPDVKPYAHHAIRLSAQGARHRSAPTSANATTPTTHQAPPHDCVTPALDRTSADILLEDAGFENAYADYSTRLIIMEQRNLYCGSYNVMVLMGSLEAAQITALDTDSCSLIAYASLDRKIRFISPYTGEVSPVTIHGHAGSIRCIALSENKDIVISGSYDTSIRCWSLTTGKCIRIYRGHTDTVTCVLINNNILASGARDTLCKVWNIDTGEQLMTFKHRHPVSCVALSKKLCITGCDNGIVKVWSIKSQELIKKLHAHHSVVTGIKFDRWHIVTAAKDGNALVWSSQGDHNKCLAALRHPKEITCLEFMYLRALTGCIDGKIRVWNILNGNCLRIMRGNSKSDAIFRMTATETRITVNTSTNVLVLNFEPIDYDYTLADDKSPSLIQYSRYEDTPIRQRPYAYVRAQRMSKAGASDTRILKNSELYPGQFTTIDGCEGVGCTGVGGGLGGVGAIGNSLGKLQQAVNQTSQTSHSARPLTGQTRSAGGGQLTPRRGVTPSATPGSAVNSTGQLTKRSAAKSTTPFISEGDDQSIVANEKTTTRAKANVHFRLDKPLSARDCPGERKRRVSWAFERTPEKLKNGKGTKAKKKEQNIDDMKSLLRSQIRMQSTEILPPDFVYLSVNKIQESLKPTPSDVWKRRDDKVKYDQSHPVSSQFSEHLAAVTRGDFSARPEVRQRSRQRPQSSPCAIDARSKITPVELESQLSSRGITPKLKNVKEDNGEKTDRQSVTSASSRVHDRPRAPTPSSARIIIDTEYGNRHMNRPTTSTSTNADGRHSVYSEAVNTSIPATTILRPVSAKIDKEKSVNSEPRIMSKAKRLRSANMTAQDNQLPTGGDNKRIHMKTTKGVHGMQIPMLMYSDESRLKMENLKKQRLEMRELALRGQRSDELGRVSEYNDPMRRHVSFKLYTYRQVEHQFQEIESKRLYNERRQKRDLLKWQRNAWLEKVKNSQHQQQQTTIRIA